MNTNLISWIFVIVICLSIIIFIILNNTDRYVEETIIEDWYWNNVPHDWGGDHSFKGHCNNSLVLLKFRLNNTVTGTQWLGGCKV